MYMKKLLLLCLLISSWSSAQNLQFKSERFKKFIINFNQIYNHIDKLDKNSDGEIDTNEANILKMLSISPLDSLNSFEDLLLFKNLNAVYFLQYDLDSINLNGLQNVDTLSFDRVTNLKNFDATILKKLKYFEIAESYKLETVDLSNLNELKILRLGDYYKNNDSVTTWKTTIKNIDLSTNVNIDTLLIYSENLYNLDLSKNINIKSLDIKHSKISSIDLSNNKELGEFISSDSLINLDLSNNFKLDTIYLASNVSYANLKNGSSDWKIGIGEPNSHLYICIDDKNILKIEKALDSTNYLRVQTNSYCTFTPGGGFNQVKSKVNFNLSDDCTGNEAFLAYTKFSIEDQNGKGFSVTDNQGLVNFYKQKGSYILTPELENPTYFQISPQSLNFSLIDNSGHDTTINFCITPNGIQKDVEVVLAPYGQARPGFDATYLVTYKNKGNQTLSCDVSVQYNEDVLDFVRSTMSTQTSGLVSTSFIDLKPFEVKVDTLVLNVNSPIESPAVNINDTLKFIATINPTNEDETPEDNMFAFNQTVVGAYDPNLITCLEGNVLNPTEIGKTLHYTIEFENTGNYPAENIVVVEEIDPTKYDINSLQILNTSHPMKLRIVGKKVEYYFENIDLGEHKHGNILLKLQGLKNLNEGDTVSKQADIYFDYNAPVQTNDEATVYRDLKASIATLKEDISINVYPNPGKGMVHIEAAKNIKSLDIYDVNGRVIQSKLINTNATAVNLSEEITGIYFIKVISEEGAKVIKYQKD